MSAEEATQGAEAPSRRDRSWVEASIWTPRMLSALDNGVKGGKWYSLIDKVCSQATLEEAFAQVEANAGAAGVDHVTVKQYAKEEDANLKRLSEELRSGRYRPQRIRRASLLSGRGSRRQTAQQKPPC